jgi:hypothetical protein
MQWAGTAAAEARRMDDITRDELGRVCGGFKWNDTATWKKYNADPGRCGAGDSSPWMNKKDGTPIHTGACKLHDFVVDNGVARGLTHDQASSTPLAKTLWWPAAASFVGVWGADRLLHH